MPVLDRQAVPTRRAVDGRPIVPARVPEAHPTPLQQHFIGISVVALIAGTIAISAWELGQPLGASIVKGPTLVASGTLLLVTSDATLRIWRSARAWLPLDRGRALFRLGWVAVLLLGLALELAAALLVLTA